MEVRYCPWCGTSQREEIGLDLLLFRAYHQLMRARKKADHKDGLWDHIHIAAANTETARVLVEGAEVLEDDGVTNQEWSQ